MYLQVYHNFMVLLTGLKMKIYQEICLAFPHIDMEY